MRRSTLLTSEINAAVDSSFDGGAGEVVVWNRHGMAHNRSATTIHLKARTDLRAGFNMMQLTSTAFRECSQTPVREQRKLLELAIESHCLMRALRK